MARFRIKSLKSEKWYDVCQVPMYVKRLDGKWQRLLPGNFKAYHGTRKYWMEIDCISETGNYDDFYGGTPDGLGQNNTGTGLPPDGQLPAGPDNPNPSQPQQNQSGTVTDPSTGNQVDSDKVNTTTNQRNDGNASSNANTFTSSDLGSTPQGIGDSNSVTGTYVKNEPYPSGYDLPDSGDINSGERKKDDGSTCISRAGLGTCEENKTGNQKSSCAGDGTFTNPKPCPCTLFSEEPYIIQEFYTDVGQVTGEVFVDYEIIGKASIDVYHAGVRQVTTNGKVTGAGRLNFPFDSALGNGESKLFIRVRRDKGSEWQLSWSCPTDEYIEEKGTLSDPASCHGTFEPRQGASGINEYVHDLGPDAGEVVLLYQMWNIPDKLDILYRGNVVASTGGFVSGQNTLKFNYNPVGGVTTITIRIIADARNTTWAYQLSCPDQKGSVLNPKTCGAGAGVVHSGGAGITDTYYQLGDLEGRVRVRFQMWNIADKLEVFQSGNLVATTGGPVAGESEVEFLYKPPLGKEIMVRVSGSGETSWSFLLECPETVAEISIGNVTVTEGDSGLTQMCFPVTVDPITGNTISVDYTTVDGSAKSAIGNSSILAEDSAGNPFIAVMEGTDGVGRVVYDGGFPKYYNAHIGSVSSYNDLPNQFKFMNNVYNWIKNNRNGKVFGYSFASSSYNIASNSSQGFKSGIEKTLSVSGVGFDAFTNSNFPEITLSDIENYNAIFLFSVGTSLSDNSAAALAAYVQQGGGIFVVTDHDPFQVDANKVIKAFNAEFYGSVNRSPVAVSDMISRYGNHPLWNNISGNLPAGGSEGNIRILTATTDYKPKSGTLTIPSGTASSQICIPITGDYEIEGDETLKVVLSNPVNVNIKVGEGVGTITNDDTTPPPPPPVPCGQSTASGGQGTTTTTHNIGSNSGRVKISYDAYSLGDRFDVYYNGVMVATTGGIVSGKGDLFFDHDASTGETECVVTVSAPSSGTGWNYTVHCPE